MRARALVICGISSTMVVLAATLPASALTPHKFIDSSKPLWGIAVDSGAHAWSTGRKVGNIYAYTTKVDQAGTVRAVNPARTSAFPGGIELGGTHGDVLVYAQGKKYGSGDWNIRLYDMDTHTSTSAPTLVSSSSHIEMDPSISGDYLLFDRGPLSGKGTIQDQKRVLLYRYSTNTLMTLADAPNGGDVFAGRVLGDFAVWTVCPKRGSGRCNVFRYQISTGLTIKVPLPAGRAQYYATLSSTDGTMFFVRGSPTRCGDHSRLMKRDTAGSVTALAELPQGVEAATLYGYDNGTTTNLYFNRIVCATFNTGIYVLKGV
jgi:hypothetical protein